MLSLSIFRESNDCNCSVYGQIIDENLIYEHVFDKYVFDCNINRFIMNMDIKFGIKQFNFLKTLEDVCNRGINNIINQNYYSIVYPFIRKFILENTASFIDEYCERNNTTNFNLDKYFSPSVYCKIRYENDDVDIYDISQIILNRQLISRKIIKKPINVDYSFIIKDR